MGLPGANPTQYIQIYEKNIEPNLLDNQNVLFAIFLGNDFENLLYLTDVNDDGKGESFKQSIFSVENNILHRSGIYRLSYLINAVECRYINSIIQIIQKYIFQLKAEVRFIRIRISMMSLLI